MKLHLINSATLRVKSSLICKGTTGQTNLNVRFGIFEHSDLGPVLIDAGYAPRVVSGSQRSLPLRLYGAVLNPQISQAGHPDAALAQLGYNRRDVRHVILTHLHADHVGYLDLFDSAELHLTRQCCEILRKRPGLRGLRHGVFSELLPQFRENRANPFEAGILRTLPGDLGEGRDVFGDGSCLSVSLPGHAAGHTGLYFPKLEVPMLYAVDAAWSREAILKSRSPGWPAHLVAQDRHAEAETCLRLRNFVAGGGHMALCHEAQQTPWDLLSSFQDTI